MAARSRARRGQAMIEYMFLFVLLATIGVAVLVLAGSQLNATYQDVQWELAHLGMTTSSGPAPFTCPDGTAAVLYGHMYRCG